MHPWQESAEHALRRHTCRVLVLTSDADQIRGALQLRLLPPIDGPGARMNRCTDLIGLLLAGLLLGALWDWAPRPDPSPGEYFAYPAHEYFPLMVEGWLQGRLDLPLPEPEGLLSLSDPHDPVANEPFRHAGEQGVHDLSLYDGRLYMYWGPTPALVAFLP